MRKRILVCLLAWAMAHFLTLGTMALAQGDLATVTGRVFDPNAAVIIEATVTARNVDTGIETVVHTNEDGIYRFVDLSPGNYEFSVSKRGFKVIVKPGVTLHVGDTVSMNFSMQVGAVNETVRVEGGAPLVNTESAEVSTVIDRDFAGNLPLNGRSFNTLLQLTPGVTIVPSTGVGAGQFSVSGERTNANSFQVDGVSANFGSSPFIGLGQSGGGGTQAFNAYGGTSSLVSVDALQEFRVETSSYAPEFGRTPGGQVIISTRSGANEFHGTAFDYFRNTVLDANDWFANAAGKPRAEDHQNDFGGVLGGPIWHDKTFFFFSYEGLRLRQPQAMPIQVPSLAWRASATNPKAAAVLNAYPKPDANAPVSADGDASPFTGVWSNQVTTDATSLRIDHHFNDHLSVFGRFNRSPSQNSIRLLSLSTTSTTKFDTTTFTAGANWLISGTLFDSVRFNYSRQTASGSYQLDNFGGATPISPAGLLPAGTSVNDARANFDGGFVNIFSGANDLIQTLSVGSTGRNQVGQWNVLDDFSATKGSHQLKFGVDFRRLPIVQTALTSGLDYIPADPVQFATKATVSFLDNQTIKSARFYFQSFSAYVQDRWNIGTRLTLTYGLRWEVNPAPTPTSGTYFASWQNVNNPAQIALAPAGTPLWNTTYGNFAPRVGIAWRATQRGDLVIRAGFGVFYDLGTGVAAQVAAAFPNNALFSSPFPATTTYPVPITDLASITASTSLQPLYVAQNMTAFSPDLKLPYSYQWNVALEKSLWGRQALTLTYLGQAGRRLLREEGITDPNANFQGSGFFLTRNGDTSDYDALQVQFRRPLAQRLQALASYTYSHCIDTNSNDSFLGLSHFILSVSGERGSCDVDVRHNVTSAVTYEVPSLKQNHSFNKMITEGWSLDGVFQVRTGFPLLIFTPSLAIPGQLGNTGALRPDLVPGVPIWIDDPTAPGGKRLNPLAFVIPTTNRQGTLGRNRFAGFGATQIDASLGRKFGLSEKVNLQFRADVFNVVNHPNFSSTDFSGMPFSSCSGNPGDHCSQPFGVASQMLNQGLGGLNALYQIGGPRSMQLSLKLLF